MTAMTPIKVFRNINLKDKFMGLELVDGCILLVVFFAAFMVNKESLFVNALVLVGAYLGLRTLKRGKPDGYLLCLVRYALATRFKRIERPDEGDQEGYPRP